MKIAFKHGIWKEKIRRDTTGSSKEDSRSGKKTSK
jgi:hypothetical protein